MNQKIKQALAVIGIILLVSLYVATLIVALLDFPGQSQIFAAMLMASIGLPILLWIMLWSLKKMKDKKEPQDPNM